MGLATKFGHSLVSPARARQGFRFAAMKPAVVTWLLVPIGTASSLPSARADGFHGGYVGGEQLGFQC